MAWAVDFLVAASPVKNAEKSMRGISRLASETAVDTAWGFIVAWLVMEEDTTGREFCGGR